MTTMSTDSFPNGPNVKLNPALHPVPAPQHPTFPRPPPSDSYTRTLTALAARPSKTLSHSRSYRSSSIPEDGVHTGGSTSSSNGSSSGKGDAEVILGREVEMHEAVRRAMGLRRISEVDTPGFTTPNEGGLKLSADVAVSASGPEEEGLELDAEDGQEEGETEEPETDFSVAISHQPRRISFKEEATFYHATPSARTSTSSLESGSEKDPLEVQTPTSDFHPLPDEDDPDLISSEEDEPLTIAVRHLLTADPSPVVDDFQTPSPTSATAEKPSHLSFKKIFRRSSVATSEEGPPSPVQQSPKRSSSNTSLSGISSSPVDVSSKEETGGSLGRHFKVTSLFKPHAHLIPPTRASTLPSASSRRMTTVPPPPARQPQSKRPRAARPEIKIVTEADIARQSRELEEAGDEEAMKTAEICFLL